MSIPQHFDISLEQCLGCYMTLCLWAVIIDIGVATGTEGSCLL